nr:MAG TPA: hypothetical protein [Caudoviricetes sp.]
MAYYLMRDMHFILEMKLITEEQFVLWRGTVV